MGPTSRRVGESTRITRREKVGIKVMGTRICTCKVGDGLEILRTSLMLLKGLSIKVLSTMLDPLLSPMMFLMDLLVRFAWEIFFFFFFFWGFDWVVGKWGVFDLFGSWLSNVKWVYSVFDLKMSVCEELLLRNGFWVLKTLV